MAPRTWDDKIVLLGPQRQKAQSVSASDWLNRHAPVRASLFDGGGHGIVGTRFGQKTCRTRRAEQTIYQNARPAAAIAIDQHASLICESRGDSRTNVSSRKVRVVRAENDTLQTAITRDQIQGIAHERAIVRVRLRIKQVNAGHIAFTAFGGFQSPGAADGKHLACHTTTMQLSQ